MTTRRRFLAAGVAGAATLVRVPPVLAAKDTSRYDFVIKGGRVMDPARGLDAIRDVAIANGRIVAVAAQIKPGAAETLDASAKLVLPGLVDIHTHAARSKDGPALCLEDGVTAWVDGGSRGADGIDEAIAITRAASNRGRVLINIARTGIVAGGELKDIAVADVAAARAAVLRHRDMIIGVKARLSNDVAGVNDLEALRRAQAVARPFGLPVMIHMGQTVSPLPAILDLLKRGDIVTHLYAPAPNGILDAEGRVLPQVLAARRRGIVFDFANGRNGHVTWDVAERAMRQGFWPDTISTDWNTQSRTTGVVDFPNVMSKFLLLGMPLGEVIARSTIKPARVFKAFAARGTLRIGAPADVAILELREGSFEFVDNYKATRTGRQRLFPIATVTGGKRAPARA